MDGGNAPTDSSVTGQYMQIRYSGFAFSGGNELQGLTTGGVGSGTTLEYIQVHNSSDDGMVLFGGTHSARHLVITGACADRLDSAAGGNGPEQFGSAV